MSFLTNTAWRCGIYFLISNSIKDFPQVKCFYLVKYFRNALIFMHGGNIANSRPPVKRREKLTILDFSAKLV
jgi:hypothetical protein